MIGFKFDISHQNNEKQPSKTINRIHKIQRTAKKIKSVSKKKKDLKLETVVFLSILVSIEKKFFRLSEYLVFILQKKIF